MNDKDFQKKHIDLIFRDASMAPVFKTHPKYCTNQFSGLIPYICYDDVMEMKYIIRGRPLGQANSFDYEKREIIVEYKSVDEMVNDGWRLD